MNKLDFYLFHLMPYPYIPPGEEIESTWVTLPNSHYDPKVGHRLYNEYLEQLIAGERLGYDGLCVNEHHQNAYGTMPSPDIMASFLVAKTGHDDPSHVGAVEIEVGLRLPALRRRVFVGRCRHRDAGVDAEPFQPLALRFGDGAHSVNPSRLPKMLHLESSPGQ